MLHAQPRRFAGRICPNLKVKSGRTMGNENLQEVVKQKYGNAAKQVAAGGVASCGGSGALSCCDPITKDLYDPSQTSALPKEAVAASLGCGNPTALAKLQPGETVLDLGSGGGIDVLLSAKRVGPKGKAYGLDMTDEMLALARENQKESGVTNVEFLKGTIENIPLPDNSVDVVISNCVINLSGDKDRVLREAFRVLKPGGRLAVSDVVLRGEVPSEIRKSMELWVGCIAGALQETEYVEKLDAAGFDGVEVETTPGYPVEGLRSKSWDEFAKPGAPQMHFVFTVCDSAAAEICPVWPGKPVTAHWGIPDPGNVAGSPDEIARAFRDAFVTLGRRIDLFLSLPIEKLDTLAVKKEMDRIGRE